MAIRQDERTEPESIGAAQQREAGGPRNSLAIGKLVEAR
jgi:hypothetical protein